MIATRQAFSQPHAFAIDQEPRLSVDEPSHGDGQRFTPRPKFVGRGWPCQQAMRFEMLKRGGLEDLVTL